MVEDGDHGSDAHSGGDEHEGRVLWRLIVEEEQAAWVSDLDFVTNIKVFVQTVRDQTGHTGRFTWFLLHADAVVLPISLHRVFAERVLTRLEGSKLLHPNAETDVLARLVGWERLAI